MIIEESGNVRMVKGTPEELKEYRAKHDLTVEDGMLVISADIPRDGYYKEKIQNQAKYCSDLERENAKLKEWLDMAKARIEKQDKTIAKLKDALVKSAIEE